MWVDNPSLQIVISDSRSPEFGPCRCKEDLSWATPSISLMLLTLHITCLQLTGFLTHSNNAAWSCCFQTKDDHNVATGGSGTGVRCHPHAGCSNYSPIWCLASAWAGTSTSDISASAPSAGPPRASTLNTGHLSYLGSCSSTNNIFLDSVEKAMVKYGVR